MTAEIALSKVAIQTHEVRGGSFRFVKDGKPSERACCTYRRAPRRRLRSCARWDMTKLALCRATLVANLASRIL